MDRTPNPSEYESLVGLTFLKYLVGVTAGVSLLTLINYGGLAARYWQAGCVTGRSLYFLILAPLVLLATGLATLWLGRRPLHLDDWRQRLAPFVILGHTAMLLLIGLTLLLQLRHPYLEPRVIFGIAAC